VPLPVNPASKGPALFVATAIKQSQGEALRRANEEGRI
jgi:hypothetical protein